MHTQATLKINDIEEFCKLYKINIPVEAEFDYYVKTLKKSKEFDSIDKHKLQDNIDSFVELEKFVSENGYSSVREYKNKCLDTLKDYILSTKAYKTLLELPMPASKMSTKDHVNQTQEYDTLLSIDFVSANYSVLKSFDTDNELEKGWKDLCNKFNVHPSLSNSKSFRQIVFGNTNPKRLQTFQHVKIMSLVDFLKSIGIQEEHFVFISHDEIIIKTFGAASIYQLIDQHSGHMEDLTSMPIKFNIFSLSKIKKNTFVKTVYDIKPSFNTPGITYCLSKYYTTLHGVPGNKFFMYFKKYILKEPIEERDLLYYNDGELSKWWTQNEFSEPTDKLPHYEKPDFCITLQKAQNEYSYLWKELSVILPGMSGEEKRRAIEVFLNTCKYCYQEPAGCQCWNDD